MCVGTHVGIVSVLTGLDFHQLLLVRGSPLSMLIC